MANVSCPKCGFQQEEAEECVRCGIIFARYTPTEEPAVPSGLVAAGAGAEAETEAEEVTGPGPLRKIFRLARWAVLAGAILVIVLILIPAAAPEIDEDPGASSRLARKFRSLNAAAGAGRSYELVLDEAELNAWLQQSLEPPRREGVLNRAQRSAVDKVTGGALSRLQTQRRGAPAVSAAPPRTISAAPPSASALSGQAPPALEPVRRAMQEMRIDLEDDHFTTYVGVVVFGKDLSLLVVGRPEVRDGYFRLEVISGKLGSLPVPRSLLNRAVSPLFDSPANKEKYRLTDEIRDIRIEQGRVIVNYR